jgi:hypothetical protein
MPSRDFWLIWDFYLQLKPPNKKIAGISKIHNINSLLLSPNNYNTCQDFDRINKNKQGYASTRAVFKK